MYCCQPRVIAQDGTGALEHPAAGRFARLCAARRPVGRLLDIPALVQNVLAKGEQQFNDFTTDRLVQRTKPITDPVHRNRNHLFS